MQITGMLLGLVGFSERVDRLGLFPLGRWRPKGGPIEVHKIIKQVEIGQRIIAFSHGSGIKHKSIGLRREGRFQKMVEGASPFIYPKLSGTCCWRWWN